MEVAKVTSKGQITIPISIRRRLEINEGDKILFVYKPEGVLMVNPTTYQAGAEDFVEAAPPKAVVKPVSPVTEKSTDKASQKAVPPPVNVEPVAEDAYIEEEAVYEAPKTAPIPAPKPPPPTTQTANKQVGGVDLSTLLDDIRSIGSNI